MIPTRRIAPLVVVLGSFVIGSAMEAQIQVDLKMSKRQYVAHEPVEATVTLTNRTGRDLLLHGEGVGRGVVSWLDFSVQSTRGSVLSPSSRVNFPSVKVPAGRSVAKVVNLNSLYRVSDLGTYSCHAVVRLPDGGGTFNSPRTGFGVTKGTALYRQRIGDPNGRDVREFTVSMFNASDKSAVYVHVVDVRTGRTLQTIKLGEALTFNRPQSTMDGSNTLHVLYLTAPTIFAHARISRDGKLLGTDYIKRGEDGRPGLQTYANGQVVVAGGVPYDPQAEKQQEAQIRRLSERPAITYR